MEGGRWEVKGNGWISTVSLTHKIIKLHAKDSSLPGIRLM